MFTKLESNFKGQATSLSLQKLNAITGDNQSGKTAILRAIRHALTVSPPAAQASRYFKFAPKGADELYSRLSIGSDVVASFTVFKDGKGKVRAPVHSFEGALKTLTDEQLAQLIPTVSFRELIDLGDSKAREALFRRFGQLDGQPVPRPALLGPEGDALWDRALREAVRGKTDPAEVLSDIGEWLRKEKRRLSAEIKTTKQQIDDLRAKVELQMAGAEMIPELEQQYKRALAYENLAQARVDLVAEQAKGADLHATQLALIERGGELAARQDRWRRDEEIREDERIEIVNKAAALPDSEGRLRRVETLLEVLDRMIQLGATECPIDGGTIDPVACLTRLRLVQTEIQEEERATTLSRERLRAAIDALDAASSDEADAIRDENRRLQQDQAAANVTYQTHLARLQLLQAQTASVADYEGPSSAVIAESLNGLRDGESARRQLGLLELALRQMKVAAELVKELEERAESLLESLLKKVATGAESAVNRYMLSGFEAKLQLGDGACSWCVVSPSGDLSDKEMMCGAEKASLIIALALAWTEGNPVRIALLDDEDIGPYHSTPANLQRLLLALKAAVDDGHLTQVFVAGLLENEIPQGWHQIKR